LVVGALISFSIFFNTIILISPRYCSMKKLPLQVLILASTLGLNAQTKTDSIKKIRLSGVGLESQMIFQRGYINTASQQVVR